MFSQLCSRRVSSTMVRSYSTSIRGIGKKDQDVGALQNLMRMVNQIEADMNPLTTAEFTLHTQQCRAYAMPMAVPEDAMVLPAESDDYQHIQLTQGGEAFLFKHTHVTWAIHDNPDAKDGHAVASLDYAYDQDEPTCFKGDLILLNPHCSPMLAKTAFSYAMARSARLTIFENVLDAMLLCQTPATPSVKQVLEFRKQLCEEADLGFLNTTELSWARHDLQNYYTQISERLDVHPRIEILHKKLELAKDLAANQ